jgi:DNA-directed RNA polymerase subunit RPC12/RpoP
VRFKCQSCSRRLKANEGAAGKSFICPYCRKKHMVPTDDLFDSILDVELPSTKNSKRKQDQIQPSSSPKRDSQTPASQQDRFVSEKALTLYDLLRDEPVFVDWYLTTFKTDVNRWASKELPFAVVADSPAGAK